LFIKYFRAREDMMPGQYCPLESLVARVRGEYFEMPGLRLTVAQACRLWQVDAATCERVLAQLVREGFLHKTETGFYIAATTRTGIAFHSRLYA